MTHGSSTSNYRRSSMCDWFSHNPMRWSIARCDRHVCRAQRVLTHILSDSRTSGYGHRPCHGLAASLLPPGANIQFRTARPRPGGPAPASAGRARPGCDSHARHARPWQSDRAPSKHNRTERHGQRRSGRHPVAARTATCDPSSGPRPAASTGGTLPADAARLGAGTGAATPTPRPTRRARTAAPCGVLLSRHPNPPR